MGTLISSGHSNDRIQ